MLTGAELALLYGDQARKGLVGSGQGGLFGRARALKKTIEQYNKDTEEAKRADQKAFLNVQNERQSEKDKALKEQKKQKIAQEKAKVARQKELNSQARQRQAQIAQREKNIEEGIKNKMLGMGATKAQANKAIAARRNQQQVKSDLTETVMTGKGTGKFAPVSPQPTQKGTQKYSSPTVNPLKPSVKGQITKTANKQTPKPSGTTIAPIPKPASPVIRTPGSPIKIPSKSEMDNPVVKKMMS